MKFPQSLVYLTFHFLPEYAELTNGKIKAIVHDSMNGQLLSSTTAIHQEE